MSKQMKNSGAKWIGEMPKEWQVKPLKYGFQIVQGATPATDIFEFWDGEIPWVTPADMTDEGELSKGDRNITSRGLDACSTSLVPVGSIVVSTRAPIGKINRVAENSICTNQGCKTLVPTAFDPLYAYYCTIAAKEELVLHGRGTTFKELSGNDLGRIVFPCPALNEQKVIAQTIDKWNERVGTATSLLHSEIEVLEEYKRAIVQNTITKGLNQNAKMKSSGVEWIGDIPEKWAILRLKDCLQVCNGREIVVEDGDVPVYGSGGVFKWTNEPMHDGQSILFGRKGTIDRVCFVTSNPSSKAVFCHNMV